MGRGATVARCGALNVSLECDVHVTPQGGTTSRREDGAEKKKYGRNLLNAAVIYGGRVHSGKRNASVWCS